MPRAQLLVLVVLAMASPAWSDVPADFEAANQLYEDKDYEAAIQRYHAVLDSGLASAELYYNLGNAYFKAGDVGHAMLYYLRARRLAPSDEDLIHNIRFARRLSQVQMEGVELNPINSFLQSLVARYRLDTLAWVSSLFFVAFCVLLILRFGLVMMSSALRAATIVVFICLLAVAGLTTYKYRSDYVTRRAVLIAPDCPVLSGPVERADIEFQGAPGLVVEVLSESGEYYNVLFENKRRGWVREDFLAEI